VSSRLMMNSFGQTPVLFCQGPSVGGVFVANHVEEITAVGGVWSWVPTDENPADLPIRV